MPKTIKANQNSPEAERPTGSVTRAEMLPAQRHALILETVRSSGAASIQTLSSVVGVSASTVRRDLEYLTEHNYLERTHGGAVMRRLPTARFEGDATIAAATARSEKAAIGALAAQRIGANQSVIFDASSTVTAAAEAVVARAIPLTAITNDLRCAGVLSASRDIDTIVVGGAVRASSTTLTGEPGQAFLSGIHADVSLIGVHTISGGVFTETSLEVAAMKRVMVRAARRVIVLADSTKFGAPSFCDICGIEEVDEIITDDGVTAEDLDRLRAFNVDVTIAEDPSVPLKSRRG